MASQAASCGPFGFCSICGGRGHESKLCPSNTNNIPLCFHCGDLPRPGKPGHVMSQCTGRAAPKCFRCRGVGHFTNICTSSPGGGQGGESDREVMAFTVSHCYMCGGAGHYATWCGSPSKTGKPLCFKCGVEGHTERLCFSQVVAPKCDMCKGVGHSKEHCNNIAHYVVVTCEKCSNEGHVGRDCPQKSDDEYPAWHGYDACASCGGKDHFMGACKSYIAR